MEEVLDSKEMKEINTAVSTYKLEKFYENDTEIFQAYYKQIKKNYPDATLKNYGTLLRALKTFTPDNRGKLFPLDQTFRNLCANFDKKYIEHAELLLKLKPDIIDSTGESGISALERAVEKNQPDLVEFLVFHDANTEKASRKLTKNSDARIRFLAGRADYKPESIVGSSIESMRLYQEEIKPQVVASDKGLAQLALEIWRCPDIYNLKKHFLNKIKERFSGNSQNIFKVIFARYLILTDGHKHSYCVAKFFLKKYLDVNYCLNEAKGFRLIDGVAEFWQPQNLSFLIENGVKAKTLDENNMTALHYVFCANNIMVKQKKASDCLKVANILIDAGIPFDKCEGAIMPRFFSVTLGDHDDRFKAVLNELNPDISTTKDKNGKNIFHYIAQHKAIKIARYCEEKYKKDENFRGIVKKIINEYVSDYEACLGTPLSIAVAQGCAEIVDILLAMGADPKQSIYFEMAEGLKSLMLPFDIAIELGHQAIQKSLLLKMDLYQMRKKIFISLI